MGAQRDLLAALSSPEEGARAQVIKDLVKVPSLRVIPILMRIADEDPSLELRFLAKKALSVLRHRLDSGSGVAGGAVARLDHESAQVRQLAVRDLLRSGHPEGPPLLRSLLGREEDPGVLAAAAIALGIVGDEADGELLAELCDRDDAELRAAAVEGLGHLRADRFCRKLTLLVKDRDPKVKATVITVLTNMPKASVLGCFGEMLASDEITHRDAAAYALVKLEFPESIPLLEGALKDPAMAVRLKARNTLVALARRHQEAMDALERFKGEKRASPEDFLSMSTIEPPLEVLGLNSDSRQERLEAVRRAMEASATDQVRAMVGRLKREKDPSVRAAIVVALGRIGSVRALPVLKECVARGEPQVASYAVSALWSIDEDQALGELLPLLKSADNRVRASAVVALAQSPVLRVAPTLEEMIASERLPMRASAVYAITELADDRFVELLVPLLLSQDPPSVRLAGDGLNILADQGSAPARAVLDRYVAGTAVGGSGKEPGAEGGLDEE